MIKKCPTCGAEELMFGEQKSHVAISFDEQGNYVVNDTKDTKRNVLLMCHSCGQKYDMTDQSTVEMLRNLSSKATCVSCGQSYPENQIDEDGLCPVCEMKKNHPELNNIESLNQAQLIQLVAAIQKDNDKLSKEPKVEEKIEEKPKRHRRTKAEMEAARQAEAEAENETAQETVEIGNEDTETEETNPGIEISDDVAPDIPQSLSEGV